MAIINEASLSVLVIDSDIISLSSIMGLLHDCHYRVTTCERSKDALPIIRRVHIKFDIIMCDINMPDMDGLKLLEMLRLETDIPVVAMSKEHSKDIVTKAILMGACNYLVKPVRKEEVIVIWQHIIQKNSSKAAAFFPRSEIRDNNNKSIIGEENCDSISSHAKRSSDLAEVSINEIVSNKKQKSSNVDEVSKNEIVSNKKQSIDLNEVS